LLVGVLVVAAGCKDPTNPLACLGDADCTIPGTRCRLETQLCICVTDEACEDGFFCNNAGVCQETAGCSTNADCESGTYCDSGSGICLVGPPSGVGSACGLASHCPFGTICTAGTCVAGCLDEGDCPLGQICFQGQCATGDAVCSNDAFCEYGQRCEELACVDDFRGPYCRGCMPATVTNPNPCDHPRNFCLNNSQEAGGHPAFCGVDCSLEQPCPNGYACADILVIPTSRRCVNTAQCRCDAPPRFAGVCRIDEPCEPEMGSSLCRVSPHPDCGAGVCFVSTGTTTGSCTCGDDADCGGDRCVSDLCCPAGADVREDVDCFGNEGAVEGFCSCATDDDCPPDTCEGASATCALTGMPCTPGANDCPPLSCVTGFCKIGENCAPDEGLSCSIVAP
jgi:hypothetical protein